MVVYLVTSIFETEPGQFKKYTMAYDSLDAALEYVELDMAAQYEGMYKDVLTDDIKELIRMREDFFFKYGTMPHYIMIERLDVLSALPENVDNVVRFSLTEHVIEPVEGEKEAEGETDEEETDDENDDEDTDDEAEAQAEELSMEKSNVNVENNKNNITPIVETIEENLEFSAPAVPEENANGISSAESENETSESMMNEESKENTIGNTSESPINGLDEEENIMPSPETLMVDNSDSNMGSNITSAAEENMNEPAPAPEPSSTSTESNIPAALRTATGGKRRTRRKAGRGKHKSRKA